MRDSMAKLPAWLTYTTRSEMVNGKAYAYFQLHVKRWHPGFWRYVYKQAWSVSAYRPPCYRQRRGISRPFVAAWYTARVLLARRS